MKKTIILLFALIVCFTFDACGNNKSGKTIENEVPASQTEPQASSSQDGNDYESDPSLPGVVRVNLENVQYCINAPFTLQKRAGTGYMFKDEQIAAVYDHYLDGTTSEKYGVNLTDITSADKVLEGMKEQVINTCSDALIRADEITFEIDNKTSKTINGFDMCRYEGRFVLNHKYPLDYNEAKFVAYGLIKDSAPVYFVVLDISSEQNMNNIGDTADKIAKTFREYSKD